MSTSDLVGPLEAARKQLASLIPLAVETLQELALGAERDNVRLAAAEAILDRSGLSRGASLHVTTDADAHRQAEVAAIDLVERLARNKAAEAALGPAVALDTLVVLEGDVEELPLASGDVEHAIEAQAHEQ